MLSKFKAPCTGFVFNLHVNKLFLFSQLVSQLVGQRANGMAQNNEKYSNIQCRVFFCFVLFCFFLSSALLFCLLSSAIHLLKFVAIFGVVNSNLSGPTILCGTFESIRTIYPSLTLADFIHSIYLCVCICICICVYMCVYHRAQIFDNAHANCVFLFAISLCVFAKLAKYN